MLIRGDACVSAATALVPTDGRNRGFGPEVRKILAGRKSSGPMLTGRRPVVELRSWVGCPPAVLERGSFLLCRRSSRHRREGSRRPRLNVCHHVPLRALEAGSRSSSPPVPNARRPDAAIGVAARPGCPQRDHVGHMPRARQPRVVLKSQMNVEVTTTAKASWGRIPGVRSRGVLPFRVPRCR